MNTIFIANKKRKMDGLIKEFGQIPFLDVTSSSEDPLMRTLSPMYHHEGIPVAFTNRTLTASSVEAIWQGLKVFEREGADFDWFKKFGGSGIKRVASVSGRGKILGHQQGLHKDRPLLSIIDARRLIYAPTYKWVLDNKAQEAINKIKSLLSVSNVVLLESGNERDIRDIFTPMPHSALIRMYIEGRYPSSSEPWIPYTEEEHQRDIDLRKTNKRLNQQKQKGLFETD